MQKDYKVEEGVAIDFIREAEKRLWHYKDMKRSLGWQEREISKLKWAGSPIDISAMSMDGMPKGNRSDEAINIAFKIKMYMGMVESTEDELKEVDKVLEEISKDKGCELYGRVLKMWYIEGVPKDEIAGVLHYSSRTSIYEIKNEAIRKFAVVLFGVDAVKAI